MKLLVVYCFIENIKKYFTQCLCISVKTKYSDNKTIDFINNKDLSFKNNKKLGIIYEDIEYKSITDL